MKSLRCETQDHWLLLGSGLFGFVGHPLLKKTFISRTNCVNLMKTNDI